MFIIVSTNGDHNRRICSEEMRKPKEATDGNLRRATWAVAHGGIRGGTGCLFVCVCLCGAGGVTARMTIGFLIWAPRFWFVRWAAVPNGSSPKPLSVSELDVRS